ncbi:MAG: TIGR03545 family protein, partial [Bdellovibrionaceae bacterium]|nr:TIGR03545 family protein [Pseudobdellovibrionaceae bacterium]
MTDTNTTKTPTAATKKGPKKKGPIRIEAIVPFGIVVALIWVYFAIFFDGHVRRAIEFGGTFANGAEVNVGSVKTSFLGASLEISDIQVTDVDEPAKNKIQIGTIRWKMLWDALLRGKVAIQDASILDIGISTARKRPGRVLPKPPPGTQSGSEKLREAALDQAQKQFEGNVLGDVAAMLGGVDPKEQLKNIEGQLTSVLRTKELQEELKKKEQEWKERLASLPQSKDLKDIETRIKSVKLDGFKGPLEVQQSIKELDAIRRDVDTKVKAVDSTAKTLNSDVNTYSKTISDLNEMVKKDIDDIEKRLQIPKLDVKNLAGNLFGDMFLTKVKQAKHYME